MFYKSVPNNPKPEREWDVSLDPPLTLISQHRKILSDLHSITSFPPLLPLRPLGPHLSDAPLTLS